MSTFWSAWIIVLTVFSIIAVTWLLFANRKTRNPRGDNTTGHVYDGIEEYDNPLPAWWFYLFIASIVFGIAYLIFYPGLGSYPGVLGWTMEKQLEKDVQRAEAKYGEIFAAYADVPVEQLVEDKQALKMGRRLFANNCAQCHGAQARGAFGFPNLTDKDWLYGGSPEQIQQSITKGRRGAMPAWGAVVGDDGVKQLAEYVLSLGGAEHDKAMAADGGKLFQMYCVACHGAGGDGNPLMGAPRLNDDIWLYGGERQQVRFSIDKGRNGEMPAHENLIKADKIHLIATYVYSLSNT